MKLRKIKSKDPDCPRERACVYPFPIFDLLKAGLPRTGDSEFLFTPFVVGCPPKPIWEEPIPLWGNDRGLGLLFFKVQKKRSHQSKRRVSVAVEPCQGEGKNVDASCFGLRKSRAKFHPGGSSDISCCCEAVEMMSTKFLREKGREFWEQRIV